MKDAIIFRDLHIKRQPLFKPVLPIDCESEKIHVEFSRFHFIEYSKYWCRISEWHRVTTPLSTQHLTTKLSRGQTAKRVGRRLKHLDCACASHLNDTMGVEATDIYVLFRENPAENHYCGGTPLAPWVPADA